MKIGIERNQTYTIRRAVAPPDLSSTWESPDWQGAESAEVNHFHPCSSDHRPRVQVKVQYDPVGLYVLFNVRDRYVRCEHTEPQSPVFRDSCVEFFIEPLANGGYFNCEINCGGAVLMWHNRSPRRDYAPVPPALLSLAQIHHTLPRVVMPEIAECVEWHIGCHVPFVLFEKLVGTVAKQEWRGNFYKCGDDTSHPHWASWAPIGDVLDFHQPQFFGRLRFGGDNLPTGK